MCWFGRWPIKSDCAAGRVAQYVDCRADSTHLQITNPTPVKIRAQQLENHHSEHLMVGVVVVELVVVVVELVVVVVVEISTR